MPSREQELRCVEAVCCFLTRETGAAWQTVGWPDDLHQGEPSPDVLLTDGKDNLAVEIKRLTDGEEFDEYFGAQESLYTSLAPNGTGVYTLIPPALVRFPLDKKLVHNISKNIARAAVGLQVGHRMNLPIPRRAPVKFMPRSDMGGVFCQHAHQGEVRAVSPGVTGLYLLEDDGPSHQFLSDDRRLAFHREIRRACTASRKNGKATAAWSEEWELLRHGDEAEGQGGVEVMAFAADFLESAAIKSVAKAISAAREKFGTKKWAERSAVALHAGELWDQVPLALYADAIRELKAADVHPLDEIFLVRGSLVRRFTLNK